MQSTFSAAMFSAVWTAIYTVSAWQKFAFSFLLFAWLLEGFVLTSWKKIMLCQVSKLRELSIWWKLQYDILSYWGSKITLIRQAPTGDWNIFMVARWKIWSPNSIKKIFPSRQNIKTQSFSRRFFAWKYSSCTPTPKRSHESDSTCKGIKISCSWNGVFAK